MKSPATLVTLVAAAMSLGLAGLLPAVVCLLTMLLVGLVGVLVPARLPQVAEVSWRRTALAGLALALVVLATALTGPQNLLTGHADDLLAGAAASLAVPDGVPLGLLSALAAGSLIAVTLELGHHRGVQSGLVLGTAVLGLACVTAPSGQRLLVPIIVGWPAALLALTKLTGGESRPSGSGFRMTLTRPARASDDATFGPALRWRLMPMVLAIGLSCGLLGAAAVSGAARIAQKAIAGSGGGGGSGSGRAWDSKFLGGRMSLNTRGPLSESPVAEVPALAPAYWRTAILDRYNGTGWVTTGTSGISTTLTQTSGGVLLRTSGDDAATTLGLDDNTGDGSNSTGDGSTDPDGDRPGSDFESGSEPGGSPSPSTSPGSIAPSIGASPADPGVTDPADPHLGAASSGPQAPARHPAVGLIPVKHDTANHHPSATENHGNTAQYGTAPKHGTMGPSATTEPVNTQTATGQTATTQLGPTRTDEVKVRGEGTAQVISPGRVVSADLTGQSSDRVFVSNGDRVLLTARNNETYAVTSQVYPEVEQPSSLGAGVDDAVAGSSTPTIDPRWLQVPATLPTRVHNLGAELTGTAPTRLAAVQAVETRLRRTISYTLDAPVPPPGQDAVDYAIFESRQGFCEHYASAEIMLLRSAGIPARMVVGYRADGTDLTSDGRQILRGTQAHAWVEVWFPGSGWVISDPTGSGRLDQSFLQSMNSAFNRTMSGLADAAVSFVTGVIGPVILAGVLLVLWLFRRPLLSGLARITRRAPRPDPDDRRPRIDPVLRKAFAHLESTLGERSRAPNETIEGLRARIVGARHYSEPEQAAELEAAFAVLLRALYAETPPTREECDEAAAAFGREADRVPAAEPVSRWSVSGSRRS